MVRGAGMDRWAHTSSLLSMLHNTTPGITEENMRDPDHFNPYAVKRKEETIEVPVQALRYIFTRSRPKQNASDAP